MDDVGADAEETPVDASVVIPTFNGERYLAEVLDAVAAQDYPGVVETLVIDSGSTDATLDIVRARPRVRLHEIPNDEFGHGRTRNLGARLARGRTVAFLTQDATPVGHGWLAGLTAPLDDDEVAGVFGKQIPRPHCVPLMKYDIIGAFAAQGVDGQVSRRAVFEGSRDAVPDELAFYSDVNAASRRSFLLDVIPYQDIPYSEDVAFARDALQAGYATAYAPDGAVVHSNDATIGEYRMRMFDETVGLRRSGNKVDVMSLPSAFAHAAVGAMRDTSRIARDRDYSLVEKLRWMAVNPFYHLSRWRGISAGSRVSLDDEAGTGRHSWERRKRQ